MSDIFTAIWPNGGAGLLDAISARDQGMIGSSVRTVQVNEAPVVQGVQALSAVFALALDLCA